MRKIIFSLTCSAIFLSTLSAHAEDTQAGDCDYKNQTIPSLFCLGPAVLSDTTVQGKVSVAGPLLAERTNIDSMEVGGVANVNDSEVKSNVVVMGDLSAKNGTFEGNLTINSSKMVFDASTVKGSITIKSPDKDPVLELYCETEIGGDVIFQGEAGKIKKSDDSTIKGKVVNGTVEVVKSPKACE